jgi:hypothetical protein
MKIIVSGLNILNFSIKVVFLFILNNNMNFLLEECCYNYSYEILLCEYLRDVIYLDELHKGRFNRNGEFAVEENSAFFMRTYSLLDLKNKGIKRELLMEGLYLTNEKIAEFLKKQNPEILSKLGYKVIKDLKDENIK